MIELIYKIKYGKYKVFGSKSYKPCLNSEISAILKLGKEDCSAIEFLILESITMEILHLLNLVQIV